MHSATKKKVLPVALLGTLFLNACGGGGGSSSSSTSMGPPPTPAPARSACGASSALSGIGSPASAGRLFAQTTAAYDDRHLEVYYRTKPFLRGEDRFKNVESFDGIISGTDIGPGPQNTVARVVTVRPGHLDAVNGYLRGRPEIADVVPVRLRAPKISVPIVPNDPLFDNKTQWDMFVIGMEHAWGYTTGDPNVQIAVIDTGFDPANRELQGKVAFYETIDKGNGSIDSSAAAIEDTDGHGTNVSGIAADETNNSYGFAGVGFNVKLQEYKVIGTTGCGSVADEIVAINEAVRHNAKVINLSIGGTQCPDSPDPAEAAAIANAINKGVVVVAAASNDAPKCTQISYPAGYAGVIAVGASALNDSNPKQLSEYVAPYSNYTASATNSLSLVAPGGDPSSGNDPDVRHWISNIYSNSATKFACTFQPCSILIAGTSQATPHVSGAAALLFSIRPGFSVAHVKDLLQKTADDIGGGAKQGSGRLNVYRALAVGSGDPNPP